jgi:hypothetical protein
MFFTNIRLRNYKNYENPVTILTTKGLIRFIGELTSVFGNPVPMETGDCDFIHVLFRLKAISLVTKIECVYCEVGISSLNAIKSTVFSLRMVNG